MNSNINEKRFIKSVLKKSKFLSFSTSLLVSFLITGQLSFADTSKDIPTRIEINSGIETESAKVENLLKNNKSNVNLLDLEIFKLLNQGKQVINPWERSWQFGIEYWHGINKGKRYSMPSFVDDTYSDPLEKYTASKHSHKTYGHITVPQITEPTSSIKLTVGIPLKKEPHFYDIEKPVVNNVIIKADPVHVDRSLPLSVKFRPDVFPYSVAKISKTIEKIKIAPGIYSKKNGNNGIFSQISLEEGDIKFSGNNSIQNMEEIKINSGLAIGLGMTSSPNEQINRNPKALLTLSNIPYSSIGKKVTIDSRYSGLSSLVAADYNGKVESNLGDDLSNKINTYSQYDKYIGAKQDNKLQKSLFINEGIINLTARDVNFFQQTTSGEKESYANRINYIVNTGIINNSSNSSIFSHMTNYNTNSVYVNDGTINLTGKNTVGFLSKNLISNDESIDGNVAFINNGKFTISGNRSSNIGISIGEDPFDKDNNYKLLKNNTVILNTPIEIIGEKLDPSLKDETLTDDNVRYSENGNLGVFIGYSHLTSDNNQLKINIGDVDDHYTLASVGVFSEPNIIFDKNNTSENQKYFSNADNSIELNLDIILGKNAYNSGGIAFGSGKSTVLSNSTIKIEGGKYNRAIIAPNNYTYGGFDPEEMKFEKSIYNGNIEINGGEKNIGIENSPVIFNGNMKIGDENNYVNAIGVEGINNFSSIIFGKGAKLQAYLKYMDKEQKFDDYLRLNTLSIAAGFIADTRNSIPGSDNAILNKIDLSTSDKKISATPNISIYGFYGDEIGMIAQNISGIKAQYQNLLFKNLGTGVYVDLGGFINLDGSKIEYDGNKYALYNNAGVSNAHDSDSEPKLNAPWQSKISFKNGNLILKGESTAAAIFPSFPVWSSKDIVEHLIDGFQSSEETLRNPLDDKFFYRDPSLIMFLNITLKELLDSDMGPDSFEYKDHTTDIPLYSQLPPLSEWLTANQGVPITNWEDTTEKIAIDGDITSFAGKPFKYKTVFKDGVLTNGLRKQINIFLKSLHETNLYYNYDKLYDLSGTTINVQSDKVVVFKNWYTPGTFRSSYINKIFIEPFGKDINIMSTPTIDANGNIQKNDKYKIAIIDKRNILIDKDLTSDNSLNLRDSQDKNNFVFRRLGATRLKLDIEASINHKISSNAASPFYNQVIGIMNVSNNKAKDNGETLTYIGQTGVIDTARTDTGNGAVGVFTNFGTVENNGKIIVENTTNPNENGIGIYAVNGSKITNNGSIEVYGNHGIGILPRPHTVDENDPIKDKG